MTEQIKMTLITPPDTLNNDNKSILLINPSDVDKDSFNKVAGRLNQSINLYLFEETDTSCPTLWLMDVVPTVDNIFINIDRSKKIEWLIGWLLGFSKTFYLTTTDHMPYNKLNVNKVYDISQVAEGVQYFEKGMDGKDEERTLR